MADIKLILVDNDGTFIPGTETRNRIALQTIVNNFAKAANVGSVELRWDQIAGQAEPDIHRWICDNGFAGFQDLISPEEFRDKAKEGYKLTPVDYTPREGMIEMLMDYKCNGAPSLLVSNSDDEMVHGGLIRIFGSVEAAREVYPIIVTKDDVIAAGLQPKPNPDPFALAVQRYNEQFGTDIKPCETVVLEDSGTGVSAGRIFTTDTDRVVQFTDATPPCGLAGHYAHDIVECRKALKQIAPEQRLKVNCQKIALAI